MHVIGTAGHVDHGKSTLVEALTGIDPDRFEEEKRRGLTIDLGFAWCTLPSGREIGIVDVPGHERFIRNMLAGAGAIDVVLFIVAADEGWMPQSAEHLQILDFLRITGGVVVLTKTDAADADALELATDDVWHRLRGSCLHDAQIVAVSARSGEGLDALRGALDDVLGSIPETEDAGRPRMFIDRSFTIAGAGTVVTGTLTGGSLRVDDEIEIAPQGLRARIRSLQTHKRSVEVAMPTSRVAANLVGLERAEITRGDALVRPGQHVTTTTFAARIEAAADLPSPLTARGAYELYLGTSDHRCRIKLLEDAPETDAIVAANTPSGLAPALRAGQSTLVQLFSARALPVDVGDRFVLRDVGRRRVAAGGVVLDQMPGRIRRRDAAELARLRAREGLTPVELGHRIVSERRIIAADELRLLAGVTLSRSPFEVANGYAPELEAKAVQLVADHHRARPLDVGIARENLRAALGLDPDAFTHLLPTWERLVIEGNSVRLAERQAPLDDAHRAAADDALTRLRSGGAVPPSLQQAGLSLDIAKALERSGELVFVTPEIAYPIDVWHDIERKVVDEIASSGPVTVARVRDMLGASRKYAVPLLGKLDSTGVTRRTGDVRELGPRGRELAS